MAKQAAEFANSPEAKRAAEFANSPMAKRAAEFANSPMDRFANDRVNYPTGMPAALPKFSFRDDDERIDAIEKRLDALDGAKG